MFIIRTITFVICINWVSTKRPPLSDSIKARSQKYNFNAPTLIRRNFSPHELEREYSRRGMPMNSKSHNIDKSKYSYGKDPLRRPLTPRPSASNKHNYLSKEALRSLSLANFPKTKLKNSDDYDLSPYKRNDFRLAYDINDLENRKYTLQYGLDKNGDLIKYRRRSLQQHPARLEYMPRKEYATDYEPSFQQQHIDFLERKVEGDLILRELDELQNYINDLRYKITSSEHYTLRKVSNKLGYNNVRRSLHGDTDEYKYKMRYKPYPLTYSTGKIDGDEFERDYYDSIPSYNPDLNYDENTLPDLHNDERNYPKNYEQDRGRDELQYEEDFDQQFPAYELNPSPEIADDPHYYDSSHHTRRHPKKKQTLSKENQMAIQALRKIFKGVNVNGGDDSDVKLVCKLTKSESERDSKKKLQLQSQEEVFYSSGRYGYDFVCRLMNKGSGETGENKAKLTFKDETEENDETNTPEEEEETTEVTESIENRNVIIRVESPIPKYKKH